MLFFPGSPAIDKGNSFGSITDQRGNTRPFDDPDTINAPGGDGSDIGAYEATVASLTVTGEPLAFGDVLVGPSPPSRATQYQEPI